jgi:hypothetical protein
MVFKKGTVSKSTKQEQEQEQIFSWELLKSMKPEMENIMCPYSSSSLPSSQQLVVYGEPRFEEKQKESDPSICKACGGTSMYPFMSEGRDICQDCGFVGEIPIYVAHHSFTDGAIFSIIMHSSYKRIHYCNERIHQWMCLDNWLLSPSDLNLVRQEIAKLPLLKTSSSSSPLLLMNKDTSTLSVSLVPTPTPSRDPATTLSKNRIRLALKAMGRPELIERWVTILCQLSKTRPPSPDSELVQTIRQLFCYVEVAFNIHKPSERKSMIHYNFVFVRILQLLNQPQYFRFFPLLKSRAKVRSIDAVWEKIADYLGWSYIPLPNAKAFKM